MHLSLLFFRQTQRHFTATTNSGLAHLEYLNTDMPIGPYDGDASTVPLSSAVAHEVHREASMKENRAGGLTDCYKKACKVQYASEFARARCLLGF